jgi:hypothetical protein
VHFLTLPTHFKNPFVRDWILLHGMLDTSRATCKRILSGWAIKQFGDTCRTCCCAWSNVNSKPTHGNSAAREAVSRSLGTGAEALS